MGLENGIVSKFIPQNEAQKVSGIATEAKRVSFFI
jgi:hypothetical protein